MSDWEVFALIGLVAFLYSSVGHAGASGYIAVLTLAGWAAAEVRPLALVMNVFVASVATVKFYRAGYFRRHLFQFLALSAVPFSALGGYLQLPAALLSKFIGCVLCISAVWLVVGKREPESVQKPGSFRMLVTGALIGLLAGISGTGGGIFLSPLMLHQRWAKLKEISAVSAPFILLNSLAGLIGLNLGGFDLPVNWLWYVLISVAGGFLGSSLGAGQLTARAIQSLLAVVLAIAGLKLLVV